MSEPKYKVGDTVVVGWAGGYSSEQTIRSVTGSRYSAKFFYDGDDGAFGEDQIIGYGEPRDEDDTTMISSDDPIDLDVIERLGAILTNVPDVPPVAPDAVNTRTRILRTAESLITGDRANDYDTKDDATGNFNRIAKLWEPILGVEITATDVALCLTQLKVARLITSPAHKDSWVDAAGYIALGGEIANKEQP